MPTMCSKGWCSAYVVEGKQDCAVHVKHPDLGPLEPGPMVFPITAEDAEARRNRIVVAFSGYLEWAVAPPLADIPKPYGTPWDDEIAAREHRA
jgi:hypothetical protein